MVAQSWEESEEREKNIANGLGAEKFVEAFRQASPYIVNHRGSTFVVVVPGSVMKKRDVLEGIIQDVALLQSLGVRVVLVLGSSEQVEDISKTRGVTSDVVDGYRVTCPEALEVAMEAAGRNHVLVQALLSRGINVAVTRKHGGNNGGGLTSRPTGVSGNFIHAKRRGVVNGVDFMYTGDVVSVDVAAVRMRLEQGDVVLLSSLGFNAAGEVLNCQCYDVAVSLAIDIGADKLISYVAPQAMPVDVEGNTMQYLPLSLAEDYIARRCAAKVIERTGGDAGSGAKSDEGDESGRENVKKGKRAMASVGGGDSAAGEWTEEMADAATDYCNVCVFDDGEKLPPLSELPSDWMRKYCWRWLKQPSLWAEDASMGTVGGPINWAEVGGSSPWERITSRGLQWRVEGCPQEVCAAVFSCKAGVNRAHLLDYTMSGSLLLELYTLDGVGAMVCRDQYEGIRPAMVGDWTHIKTLLKPLAKEGITVAISDEALINEVSLGNFHVMERDGNIIGCAALRQYRASEDAELVAEVASFAIGVAYRNEGRGDQMLQYLENEARKHGIKKIFLLTTRTASWFANRGFIHAGPAHESPLIPPGKMVQEGRNSQLYLRTLVD